LIISYRHSNKIVIFSKKGDKIDDFYEMLCELVEAIQSTPFNTKPIRIVSRKTAK